MVQRADLVKVKVTIRNKIYINMAISHLYHNITFELFTNPILLSKKNLFFGTNAVYIEPLILEGITIIL